LARVSWLAWFSCAYPWLVSHRKPATPWSLTIRYQELTWLGEMSKWVAVCARLTWCVRTYSTTLILNVWE
jgi:hypothetical protein